jgi:hypothetical protein
MSSEYFLVRVQLTPMFPWLPVGYPSFPDTSSENLRKKARKVSLATP